MKNKANDFVHSATIGINDIAMHTAVYEGTGRSTEARIVSMADTTDADALRQQGRGARLRGLHNLPEMLEMLESRLTERGAHVLWAADAQECNQHVLNIAREHGVQKIVKGKSMATEETALNHDLETAG